MIIFGGSCGCFVLGGLFFMRVLMIDSKFLVIWSDCFGMGLVVLIGRGFWGDGISLRKWFWVLFLSCWIIFMFSESIIFI